MMPVAGGNIAVRDYRTAAVPRPFRASTGSGTSGANGRPLRLGGHETRLDRKRSHAGQHVAAVRRRIDAPFADNHLHEQIIDVGVGGRRAAHDRYFARQWMRAAGAVDLPTVGAHRSHEHAIARRGIGRQVARQKIQPFRAAASHQVTRYRRLHGSVW
jgi:hypothetical protein